MAKKPDVKVVPQVFTVRILTSQDRDKILAELKRALELLFDVEIA